MRRVVGRQTHLDPVAGNHPNPKAPHPSGKLSGHRLTRLQSDLIPATAKDLLDSSRSLDQIVSRQIFASPPS